MHISKVVEYVKNEINFSQEFCEDNVFVTLRIEPILRIIENLEQSHKDILKITKENEKKDKMIDLMAGKINEAYFQENDFWSWFEKVFGIKPDGNYKKDIKQYFERKATNDG